MILRRPSIAHHPHRKVAAFTLVEAMVALSVLALFIVSSTVSLNMFNNNAAKNRNAEAARSLMENYVGLALAANSSIVPTNGSRTINGIPVDRCDAIGNFPVPNSPVDQSIALVVGRDAGAKPIVTGFLYWRVKNMGTAYNLSDDNDLVQIDFIIQYSYRGQTYSYTAQTLKANS